jgi:predicted  nucleic acid-binding Zn-ribbon protein
MPWVKPNWQMILEANLDKEDGTMSAEESNLRTDDAKARNPFDYDEKVHSFVRACDGLGLTAEQASATLGQLLELQKAGFTLETAAILAAELRKTGQSPAEAASRLAKMLASALSLEAQVAKTQQGLDQRKEQLAKTQEEIGRLEARLKALGWSEETVARLADLQSRMDTLKVGAEQVAAFSRSAEELAGRLGCTPCEAGRILPGLMDVVAEDADGNTSQVTSAAELVTLLGEAGRQGRGLTAEIASLGRQKVVLEEELAGLHTQAGRLGASMASVEAQRRSAVKEMEALGAKRRRLAGELQAIRKEHAALLQECDNMEADINLAEDVTAILDKGVPPYDLFWSLMAEIGLAKRRGPLEWKALRHQLSQPMAERIIEKIRKHFDEDMVPAWQVEEFRREALKEAADALLAEYRPHFESIVQLSGELGKLREILRAALNKLDTKAALGL